MKRPQEVGKQMKRLAREVYDVVASNSAGEITRRNNWDFFVKNLPEDYPLLELAGSCVDAMTDDQRCQLRVRMDDIERLVK